MIKDEFKIFDNLEDLSKGFTDFVKEILAENKHVNVSLSGGSTPKSLFDYWAKNEKGLEWKNLSFFWGDERCVAPDDEMSNYGMTKKHLFDHVEVPVENIHRVLGENKPADEAIRYASELDRLLEKKNGIPSFELMILGLGDDGHTVSIFPYEINLWDSKENCIVAKHPESGMERVSLNGAMVNNAQNVVFLVTGKNKAEKIRDIVKNREAFYNLYPAARVNPRSQKIYWFLDKEAASLL